MFRNLVKSTIVLGLASSAGLTAQAELGVSANVAFTNDYHWRGVTQTGQSFAVQGGFDISSDSGFYAGTWASNVDVLTTASAELDLYAGYSKELENGFSFDVGVIQYLYTRSDDAQDVVDAAGGVDLDFLEIYGGIGYGFDSGLSLGAFAAFDPDNENTYLEATAEYGFTDDLGVSLAVGNYSFDSGSDYTQTTLGVTYNFQDMFEIGAAYYDADIDGADSGLAISIAKSF